MRDPIYTALSFWAKDSYWAHLQTRTTPYYLPFTPSRVFGLLRLLVWISTLTYLWNYDYNPLLRNKIHTFTITITGTVTHAKLHKDTLIFIIHKGILYCDTDNTIQKHEKCLGLPVVESFILVETVALALCVVRKSFTTHTLQRYTKYIRISWSSWTKRWSMSMCGRHEEKCW